MREKIKKFKILIIIVIVLLVFIIIGLSMRKTKIKNITPNLQVRPQKEIISETNKNNKTIISNNLIQNLDETKNILQELFEEIGTDINSLENYLVNKDIQVDFGKIKAIEYYAEDRLDESIDFYDTEGNKIDIENTLYNENEAYFNETTGTVQGIPIPKDGQTQIEISDNLQNFKIGNYYLIKYYVPFSNYTYYFISRLSNTGFKDFDLYVISSGEVYRDYPYEADIELEN